MKKISIMILLLVAVLASCKKTPEVNLKYVDVERDLITVGTTTATIQCDYEYIATLKKAFLYYCEGADINNMSVAEMSVVQKTLYVELSGLKENSTYSYYYEFANGFNSMRSATKTFKTEASPVTPPEITLPTIVTAEVTEITSNSAQCGGEVTNDGGAEVTERGICWSTNANPTLNDSHVTSGTGTGVFTAMMNSLEANTTYHVRAYAINEAGTAFGLDKEFTTLSGGGSGDAPTGAINGLFTINENGDQVYFSQGNLQYIGSASVPYWKFADNQWSCLNNVTEQQSNSHYVDRDHFCWGTSGWNNGNVYFQPYDNETTYDPSNGYGYGPTDGISFNFDLTGSYANADWGVYNAILNGGNMPNQWRTLTLDEWVYIFMVRSTSSEIRFAKSIVNGVNGVVLLPDTWNVSVYSLNYTNASAAPFSVNNIELTDWTILEQNGAVFLPAIMLYSNSTGHYWSSSTSACDKAKMVYITESVCNPSSVNSRNHSQLVRLVQDANK